MVSDSGLMIPRLPSHYDQVEIDVMNSYSEATNLLPLQLRHLAQQHGGRLFSVKFISRLTNQDEGRVKTYQLKFESGLLLKGRHNLRHDMASRICYILNTLPYTHFSQVLASEEGCLLEEWVEGKTVDQNSPSKDDLRDVGRLQGLIHSVECPSRSTGRLRSDRYKNWMKASLLQLIFQKTLEVEDAEKVMTQLLSRLPDYCDYGVVHRDLGPDNLIRREQVLCSIDNLLIDFQAYHEDLARTWYRWGCQDEVFSVILEGYEEIRSFGTFLSEQSFWKPFVLLRAAESLGQMGYKLESQALIERLLGMTTQRSG